MLRYRRWDHESWREQTEILECSRIARASSPVCETSSPLCVWPVSSWPACPLSLQTIAMRRHRPVGDVWPGRRASQNVASLPLWTRSGDRSSLNIRWPQGQANWRCLIGRNASLVTLAGPFFWHPTQQRKTIRLRHPTNVVNETNNE